MICCPIAKLISICLVLSIFSENIPLIVAQGNTEEIDILIQEVFGPQNGNYPANNNNENNNNNINTNIGSPGSCNCVPLNLCQRYNNTALTTGEGLIDIRFGQCPNSLEICCDELRIPLPLPQPTVAYNRTVTCGKRNENGVGFRITAKDNEAQFGEFPWMVAVIVKRENGDQYHCGGSLIHPRVVLTAVHCVYSYRNKPEDLIIRAGEWDSQSDAEIIPFQQRTAQSIITHRGYQSGPAYNDIALVLLKESFDFAENVDVVCLPPPGENLDFMKCAASGWGKNEFGDKGVYSNILKRIELPIVPRNRCQELLRTTRLGPRFVLHEGFICAGGIAGIDTCKGDGGGPLVCPISGRPDHYYQAGIIAWGIGCGTNIPAVYVNVPYYRKWIDEQFANNNLDTSFFID